MFHISKSRSTKFPAAARENANHPPSYDKRKSPAVSGTDQYHGVGRDAFFPSRESEFF